jgi:TPR repeat protein
MSETFAQILAAGGKTNSLGRADEVINHILKDPSRLSELYSCLFEDNAWVRMRAVDSLEKICRIHPEWLEPYVDRFSSELTESTQPSIQWHLAQMYREIKLSDTQKRFAINWLKRLLASKEVDWIVSANAMDTLAQFTRDGSVPVSELVSLLKIQQHHKSNAVVKRATKLLDKFPT